MSWADVAATLIEGLEGFRSSPYRDTGGVWTIGFGTIKLAGRAVTATTEPVTRTQAVSALQTDMAEANRAVHRNIKRPMTTNQEAALTSLVYNIGETQFMRSSVLRDFNAGQIQAAADAFRLWNEDNGRVINGLIKRRAAERALFLK